MNNPNATNFKFRTKFQKFLNEENRHIIIGAFTKFCSMDFSTAKDVLWKMTYSQVHAYEKLYELGLNEQIVLPESILSFRNELRVQYEQTNSSGAKFSKDSIPEALREAFSVLRNSTDQITALVVYNHCFEESINPEIERILFLLKDERDNFHFGGIRLLKFDPVEAEYLKPYHIQIFNMLSAMRDFYTLNDDIPFYCEDNEDAEKEQEENFLFEYDNYDNEEEEVDKIFEECSEPQVNYRPLTPDAILEHKETFQCFVKHCDLNKLIPLSQLGFDLNKITMYREEIEAFLKAADALSSV